MFAVVKDDICSFTELADLVSLNAPVFWYPQPSQRFRLTHSGNGSEVQSHVDVRHRSWIQSSTDDSNLINIGSGYSSIFASERRPLQQLLKIRRGSMEDDDKTPVSTSNVSCFASAVSMKPSCVSALDQKGNVNDMKSSIGCRIFGIDFSKNLNTINHTARKPLDLAAVPITEDAATEADITQDSLKATKERVIETPAKSTSAGSARTRTKVHPSNFPKQALNFLSPFQHEYLHAFS